MSIHEKLATIQAELHVPKAQTNNFGGYKYRSCEDILEAVKPLVHKHGCTLILLDTMKEIGGRVYVVAEAILSDGKGDPIIVTANAREAETKKGMDDAQITGSASSYARKYALNGLFCIDDTKDADATNDHGKAPPAKKTKPTTTIVMEKINDAQDAKAVDTIYTQAMKYDWTEEEKKTLNDCRQNRLSSFA